jgi:hypothetical protein
MKTKERGVHSFLKVLAVIASSVLLVVIGAFLVFRFGIFFGKDGKEFNLTNLMTQFSNNEKSPNVQTLGDLSLEKIQISYVGGISKVTTKIINNGKTKYSVRFRIQVMGYNKQILAELTGYVGKLNEGEFRFVDSYISKELIDVQEVIYELI